jgi:DNA recombination protein RmuC
VIEALLLAGLALLILLAVLLLAGQRADRRARGEADARAGAADELALEKVRQLVEPLEEGMKAYDLAVRGMEKERAQAYGRLSEQLKGLMDNASALRQETHGLRSALKDSSARGRWGEMQLETVVKNAGMMERVDFDLQAHLKDGEKTQRPDMVVHLPGGGLLAVDAKAPGKHFFEACETESEEQASALLAQFGADVEAHVRDLSKKAYWANLDPSPEFVVMFLPVEAMLGAALRVRPGLVDEAPKNRIILATPFTLIAALYTIAGAWKQEDAAENAREIGKQAGELASRVFKMLEHVGKVGRGLESAVKGYNDVVGSYERRIRPQARRVHDLGAAGTKEPPELEIVSSGLRALPAAEGEPGAPEAQED